MQRSPSRVSFTARLFPFALALTTSTVLADQILETFSHTLTTYRAGKSKVQDAKPRVDQRAVNLDGSLRKGSTFPMAIAGNPFENVWRGEAEQNGIRLDTGTFAPTEVDISLPAPGFRWIIGRTFNARADHSGQYDSNGYQGYNWFQTSQPEIVFYDDNDNSKDTIYLVLGADRYAEYQRKTSNATEFKGMNGAAGVIQENAGTPDTYVLTDQHGYQFTFLGFDTSGNTHDGQLWKIADPASNVAYVGDSSSASTAISNGFDANGRITKAYDTADRRYTYSYSSSTIGGAKRLESVVVETKGGGTWSSPTGLLERARVEYTYLPDSPDPSYGDPGDLKTVKTTLPLTDSGINDIRTTYYRYWEGAYHASTNPGYPHALKLVVSPEGVRQFDWSDTTFDDDHFSASHDTLKAYASAYFEYDTSHRINEAWFQGRCGCSGGATGVHEYTYETNGSYTDNSGYDTTWARRTIVKRPDNAWETQVFDETGQPLGHILTEGDPSGTSPQPSKWITAVSRDAMGCVDSLATPANVTAYTHSSGAITQSSSVGLVRTFTRASSGDAKGFCTDVLWKTGTSGTAYYERTQAFDVSTSTKTIGASTLVRPLRTDSYEYPTATTTQHSGANRTQWAYTTYSGSSKPLSIEKITTTPPIVSTANNGRGTADQRQVHLRTDGLVDFESASDGTSRIIEYHAYTNGLVTSAKKDANTTSLSPPESVFEHTGTPNDHATTNAFDPQGRPDTSTDASGTISKSYYSALADRRTISIHYPRYTTGTPTYYGPASFEVRNHAGNVEAQGTIGIALAGSTLTLTSHVDESESDPLEAISATLGAVKSLTTRLYEESGEQVEAERRYFSIPATLPGTDGTHYDATLFGYDDMGRKRRTKEAHGTIRRTVYDAIGRTSAHWIGTNDSSFTGGEASGTDNMVKTDDVVYDGGADDGNSYVTLRTAYIQDSTTGRRDTTYTNDVRGNAVLIANATAPHRFNKFDNQDRQIASGAFSSTGSIVVGTDDPTTETANRLALSETLYDELGRAWKTIRHKIDASDGSDDDTLLAIHWWDRLGRPAKTRGEQLTKTRYDRLGRVVNQFTLASDDEDAGATAADDYDNAVTGVSDDEILVQENSVYETNSDNVLVRARIDRFHTDFGGGATAGALDTNADTDDLLYTASNVKGRIQISAIWYDDWDRLQNQVEYGTYAAANFDRDGLSVPSRSDTALRTTYTYDVAGRLEQVEDPKALLTRYEYDAVGRRTKVIANYVDGTPGSGDDDQTVSYAYTDGLQSSITADLPSPETDQVTTYTFGTVKGTSAGESKIATGHLLQKIQYPDSSDATNDIVAFAYNAQSQEIWKRDQATSGNNSDYNIFETVLDDSGRITDRKVTQLRASADTAVQRIATAYDSLGRVDTVTQHTAPTGGSVVDQVKYTYDGWGNVSKFEQDRDSTVSGGGNEYDVQWTWVKPAVAGRHALRLTDLTLPSGKVYTMTYRSAGGLFDFDVSRVSQIKDGSTALVTYDYVGVDQVVGTYYDEPDVMSRQYTSTAGDYADLDRFNRVTRSKWTKDLGTDVDLYKVEVGWDRNSNVTYQDDFVHAGFDVGYTNDDLNRLTRAEEGTYGGGSISSRTRDQQWTLNQTGNWNNDKLDLNGDADFVDTDEWNDTRVHNAVNELTARDLDSTSGTTGDNHTLVYDAAGNLVDDAIYKYEWDAFYRLRKVKRQNNSLIVEHKYNGLGYRISEHADTDTDNDVDANDKWYHHAYDTRWRIVATFRESDSSPKEEFVHQFGGLDGKGTGSYIDLVAYRDKDANTAWTSASDGALEERLYYCQNWRADVVAIVSSAGGQKEQVRYSAYGVPFGLPAGDCDSDGDCDTTDENQVQTWINGSAYDVRGDVDLDGDVDATDKSTIQNVFSGIALSRSVVSSSVIRNYVAYSGYRCDNSSHVRFYVRLRTFLASLGIWMGRDPVQYAQSMNLYMYAHDAPLNRIDPSGAADKSIFCGVCAYTCNLDYVEYKTIFGVPITATKCHWKPCVRQIDLCVNTPGCGHCPLFMTVEPTPPSAIPLPGRFVFHLCLPWLSIWSSCPTA